MTEELQQAVDAGKITAKAAESLSLLTPGSYCLHKSWGFGRVAEWSLLTSQILIDFPSRKGHPMQAPYAAETLQPIPEAHILARKATDPAAVKTQAAQEPVALVSDILRDLGGKATRADRRRPLPRNLRHPCLQKMVGLDQEKTQSRRTLPTPC